MYILISTTTDTKEKAQEIANSLIDKKLAACVQIDAVQSFYMREWKLISPILVPPDKEGGPLAVGGLEEKDGIEYRLAIKTKDTFFDDIAVQIRMLHTYKIPEIIATPITFITESYAQWMESVLKE